MSRRADRTERPRAWVLNLDAELEFAVSGPYQPSDSVVRTIAEQLHRIPELVSPGDHVIWPGTPPADASDFVGAAWCFTPSARARLESAGVELPEWPAFEVVRAVNRRRFQLGLGVPLPGARVAQSKSDWADSDARGLGGGVVCKREFSFASRGARRLGPNRTPAQLKDDERWVDAGLEAGELWVEPWVAIEREVALHGWLERDGRLALGAPSIQIVTPGRGWTASRRASATELSADFCTTLVDAATDTAQALHQSGYFGPFGIDAFSWRDGDRLRFAAPTDINARYTMGWALGMQP